MAISVTYDVGQHRISPHLRIITGKLTMDSSYPTGGESWDLSGKVKTLKLVFVQPRLGYILEYDYTNSKLMAYYADYNAVADGALIEVPNTTDLSSLTNCRFIVIGTV